MHWRILILFIVLLGFASAGAAARDEIQLLHRAQAGQSMTYRGEGTFALEIAGQKINIELKLVNRTRVTAVAPSGEITRETKVDSFDLNVNGEKAPTPDEVLKNVETTVIRPDGTLVSYRATEDADTAEKRKESRRLDQALQVVFSAKPVGVGDKWSYEFKDDGEKGTGPAVAEYEVVAFEKVKGIDAVRVKLRYHE